MIGSHRTDIYRFNSTDTTVIFYLQTRKITQGICHGMGVQSFQLLTFQLLGRHHFLKREFTCNNHLVKLPYRIW